MKRVLLVLAMALAASVVGGAQAAQYTIKPVIKSVEVPTKVQLPPGKNTVSVPVTATITWTGYYPWTIRHTPTTVTFAVDGKQVASEKIMPKYRLGDVRTVSTTVTLTEGKHTITVTASFPNLPQYGIEGGTDTKSVEVTVVRPVVPPKHLAGAVVKDALLAVPALAMLDPYLGYPITSALGLDQTLKDTLDSLGLKYFAEHDVGAVLPTVAMVTDLLAGWALDHKTMTNTMAMMDVGALLGAVMTPVLYSMGSPFSDLVVDLAKDVLGVSGSAEVSVASAIGVALPVVGAVVGYMADQGVKVVAQYVAPVVKALDQLLTTLGQPIAKYLTNVHV